MNLSHSSAQLLLIVRQRSTFSPKRAIRLPDILLRRQNPRRHPPTELRRSSSLLALPHIVLHHPPFIFLCTICIYLVLPLLHPDFSPAYAFPARPTDIPHCRPPPPLVVQFLHYCRASQKVARIILASCSILSTASRGVFYVALGSYGTSAGSRRSATCVTLRGDTIR